MKTVSAIALATHAGFPEKAMAEEPVLILEGQAGWISGDDQVWAVRFPPAPFQTRDVSPDTVYEGTIGIITPAQNLLPNSSSNWNVGVFARFGRTNEESAGGLGYYYYNVLGGNISTYYSVGRVEHQETHAFVDFEARRDVGLGSGQQGSLTTIIGASFGYLNAQTDTEFVYLPNPVPFTLNERRETEFIGAGPRVGFERRVPLRENIAFDLAGSAAVLFGRRTTSTITEGGVPFIGNQLHQDELDFVSMLSGRVGFTFVSPTSPASLSIGVEGRAWLNAFDQGTNVSGPPQLGDTSADRFQVNPYIRLTVPLGEKGTTLAFAPTAENAAEPVNPDSRFGVVEPVAELEVRGGFMDRGGDAINQFGIVTEDEEFGTAGVGFLLSTPVANNWMIQLEGDAETRLDDDGTSDNFDSGYSFASHLAFTNGNFLLGAFGGAGSVDIESGGTVNQDADLWFYGAQGRLLGEYGSILAQAGVFDTSADNPETISDGHFARLGGQLFLPDKQAVINADVTYLGGAQDPDGAIGPDSIDLVSWGLELEGQLSDDFNGSVVSYFAGYRNILITEDNAATSDDSISDNLFEGGIRIKFGASGLLQSQHSTAPKAPKFHRLLGAVAAVD
ncbi:MAG: Lpg1974 family pore-forming outer membrane protein [Pseudomonadota bacterium]